MGILGFGGVTKLEDMKVKDLKKERLTQEVRQDQLLVRLRHAQEQYDSMLEAASEPGLSEAEIDDSAYKMSQISKSRNKTEQDLQETLTRITVLDYTLDIISQKQELEKKGVWKTINEIPEEQFEAQIESAAIAGKQTKINLNKIIEMFDIDQQTVQSKRSKDFRKNREEILKRKQQKGG